MELEKKPQDQIAPLVLTDVQREFCLLVADAELNNLAISEKIGINPSTFYVWIKQPIIINEIAIISEQYRQSGINLLKRQARNAILNLADLAKNAKSEQIRKEAAAELLDRQDIAMKPAGPSIIANQQVNIDNSNHTEVTRSDVEYFDTVSQELKAQVNIHKSDRIRKDLPAGPIQEQLEGGDSTDSPST